MSRHPDRLRAWLDSTERVEMVAELRERVTNGAGTQHEAEFNLLLGMAADLAMHHDFIAVAVRRTSGTAEHEADDISLVWKMARRLVLERRDATQQFPCRDPWHRRLRMKPGHERVWVITPGHLGDMRTWIGRRKAIVYTAPAFRGVLWVHFVFNEPFILRPTEQPPAIRPRDTAEGPRWFP